MQNNTQRITVIDALRGFTLVGILMIHVYSYYFETTGIAPDSASLGKVERLLSLLVDRLFDGTLYTIFSFLFGISFAIQLQHAQVKRRPFKSLFLWRLLILLLIGCLHRLLFPADILRLYAVLGTVLVLCVYLNKKQVLWLSLLLFAMSVAVRLYYAALPEIVDPSRGSAAGLPFLQVFGLYKIDFLIRSGRLFLIPAMFILGLYAGRIQLFHDHDYNRTRYLRILLWSSLTLVLSAAVYLLAKRSGLQPGLHLSEFVTIIERTTLSIIFVSLILILFPLRLTHPLLNWLVPMGKMGLSIYISQSLFLVSFFSLQSSFISKIGLISLSLLTLLVVVMQRQFALWWTQKHRYGPVEYVWRKLTYIRGTTSASPANALGSKNASLNLRPNARCLETEAERER